MHNDSRMITKHLVEILTEALALSMSFGALALYGVFAFQDYEARKRNNKHKGR
jgi:hypothetical protein